MITIAQTIQYLKYFNIGKINSVSLVALDKFITLVRGVSVSVNYRQI